MTPRTDPGLDDATHRAVGAALFNHVWSLLETDARTDEQDIEVVHAAHASAYHWMKVGTPVHRARSEWQCSRVYSTLERPEAALWHAQRCLAICQREQIGDFDLAFAYEAMARAQAVAGDRDACDHWLELAQAAAADIAEADDRELLLSDLATI